MSPCEHTCTDLAAIGHQSATEEEEEEDRSRRRHHQHHVQSVFVIGRMPMARRDYAMSPSKLTLSIALGWRGRRYKPYPYHRAQRNRVAKGARHLKGSGSGSLS